jgi:hypothetical protein
MQDEYVRVRSANQSVVAICAGPARARVAARQDGILSHFPPPPSSLPVVGMSRYGFTIFTCTNSRVAPTGGVMV